MFESIEKIGDAISQNVGQLKLWFKTTAVAQIAAVVMLVIIAFKLSK